MSTKSRSVRFLTLEGQFESGVLGTFRIIRGFASLKDLAEVSVPYEEAMDVGQVRGQQRELDLQHAERIKRYLERGDQRFLPEVVLSVRTDLREELSGELRPIGVASKGDDGITITRAWKSESIRVHRVKIDRRRLSEIKTNKLIRRVDGNHRLAYAESLLDDPGLPNKYKYLASFCITVGLRDSGASISRHRTERPSHC